MEAEAGGGGGGRRAGGGGGGRLRGPRTASGEPAAHDGLATPLRADEPELAGLAPTQPGGSESSAIVVQRRLGRANGRRSTPCGVGRAQGPDGASARPTSGAGTGVDRVQGTRGRATIRSRSSAPRWPCGPSRSSPRPPRPASTMASASLAAGETIRSMPPESATLHDEAPSGDVAYAARQRRVLDDVSEPHGRGRGDIVGALGPTKKPGRSGRAASFVRLLVAATTSLPPTRPSGLRSGRRGSSSPSTRASCRRT